MFRDLQELAEVVAIGSAGEAGVHPRTPDDPLPSPPCTEIVGVHPSPHQIPCEKQSFGIHKRFYPASRVVNVRGQPM